MLLPRNHNNRFTSPTPSTRTRFRDAIHSTHRGRNTFDTVAKAYRVVTTRRKAKLRDKDRVAGQIQVRITTLPSSPGAHLAHSTERRRMPSRDWRPSRNFGCFYQRPKKLTRLSRPYFPKHSPGMSQAPLHGSRGYLGGRGPEMQEVASRCMHAAA